MNKRTDIIQSQSDQIARRLFIILSILFVSFIAVVSLVPGHHQQVKTYHEGFLWGHFPPLKDVIRYHDLRDIATNVMLYIPLGVFISCAVAKSYSDFVSPWLAIGLILSICMETAQGMVGRYPDPIDLLTNSTGYILGFWIVVFAVRRFGFRPSVFLGLNEREAMDAKVNTIAAFRFIYVAIYVIVALLPFDITVSLTQIFDKLVPGNDGRIYIILDPFYDFRNWSAQGSKIVFEMLGLLPVGILTAFKDGFNRRLNIFSPMMFCLGLAFVCELMQVFVITRVSDVLMFPLALIVGLAGWTIVSVWFKLQDIHNPHSLEPYYYRQQFLKIVIGIYLGVLCLISWTPFQVEHQPKLILKKIIYETNLIPFKEHISVRNIPTALDLVRAIGLFIPLGVLSGFYLMYYKSITSRMKSMLYSGFFCFILGSALEFSQAAFIGRYVDITDVILAGVGGMLGSVFLRLFLKNTK